MKISPLELSIEGIFTVSKPQTHSVSFKSYKFMKSKTTTGEPRYVLSHRTAEGLLHDDLYGLDHEEAWLIYLTHHCTFIGKEKISMGTLSGTAIDCKIVLRHALLNNAAAIIILHNHPSGLSGPSQRDIAFTNQLRRACALMDISLNDHIIVGEYDFYSFEMEKSYKYI